MNSVGPAAINSPVNGASGLLQLHRGALDPTPYENFLRAPQEPFLAISTLYTANYASFTNNGAGVSWIPFDPGGTDYHSVTAMIDPLTGLPRLIFGNDQGVWTMLDNNGTFETQIGSSADGVALGSSNLPMANVDRNGNLAITQFYYGAVQPSTAAAEIAGAMFYGSSQDNGGPVSDPNILTDGNLSWFGPTGDTAGVGMDETGSGTAYQYFWPCCGGFDTNFFQYIGPGLSGTGLVGSGDRRRRLHQPYVRPDSVCRRLPDARPAVALWRRRNFAVNPVDGSEVVMSSSVGRVFATDNGGVTWFDIGDPGDFGTPNSFSVALAYARPDPSAPEGTGDLGEFIYVGTQTGQIYVTQDGGGNGTSNNWINISAGLNGSAGRVNRGRPDSRDARCLCRDQDGRLLHAEFDPVGHEFAELGEHHRQHLEGRVFHLRPDLRPDAGHGQYDHAEPGAHADVARGRLALPDSDRPDQPEQGDLPGARTSAPAALAATVPGCFNRRTRVHRGPSSPARSTAPSPTAAICRTFRSLIWQRRWATSTAARACRSWPDRMKRSSSLARSQTTSPWSRTSIRSTDWPPATP